MAKTNIQIVTVSNVEKEISLRDVYKLELRCTDNFVNIYVQNQFIKLDKGESIDFLAHPNALINDVLNVDASNGILVAAYTTVQQ